MTEFQRVREIMKEDLGDTGSRTKNAVEMMKATITKEDFDRAVEQRWSVETCVVAQAARRQGLRHNSTLTYASSAVENLRDSFDHYFGKPGDEAHPALQSLRASLPIEVILSIQPNEKS